MSFLKFFSKKSTKNVELRQLERIELILEGINSLNDELNKLQNEISFLKERQDKLSHLEN